MMMQAALSRGNPHRLSTAEVDHAFPPGTPVASVCAAILAVAERIRTRGRCTQALMHGRSARTSSFISFISLSLYGFADSTVFFCCAESSIACMLSPADAPVAGTLSEQTTTPFDGAQSSTPRQWSSSWRIEEAQACAWHFP